MTREEEVFMASALAFVDGIAASDSVELVHEALRRNSRFYSAKALNTLVKAWGELPAVRDALRKGEGR